MKTIGSLIIVVLATAASAQTSQPYVPTDEERARWTLQDMRSWKIALEAYKIDHNAYPAAATLQEAAAAIQPAYIRTVPMNDAWGRPYRYERTDSGFRLASAGADGRFDRESWTAPGRQTSYDADAVISEEAKFWFRQW